MSIVSTKERLLIHSFELISMFHKTLELQINDFLLSIYLLVVCKSIVLEWELPTDSLIEFYLFYECDSGTDY